MVESLAVVNVGRCNPEEYLNYLQLGGMEYLYDTVGFYDMLKPIMQGNASTDTRVAGDAEVLDLRKSASPVL
ncbi:MAG: hypothetical protein KJN78_12985 [Gammaproteobacteria bacterium]|nr:hypothetical protein [Gammaproteobacteria bacterium]